MIGDRMSDVRRSCQDCGKRYDPFTGTRLSFRCSLIHTAVGHRSYALFHQRREQLVLDPRNHQLRPTTENQGRAAKLAISRHRARHAFLLPLNDLCDCLSWMRSQNYAADPPSSRLPTFAKLRRDESAGQALRERSRAGSCLLQR